ncbi:serine/threonine protein phosphatase 2A 57 kDa regulatory subunit B' kappa isoform-like [Cynara cardunculus var. scolymus]|uniref:serine/threonine protein phosphatase 2A 57 kDa regulatory subunit B' kappa isoform-like n=1 Tax=Cynara cardunculus var. scolymus TaxID=59895 RepID=UPI000D628E98|nr:serine/threonine protein phosphatase 2A 57 kDa regulatory subunit B' kappa isoform-like [Cynara cardunculus var. scolymus]
MSIFVPESPGLLLAANSTIPTMLKQILAKLPRKSSKSNPTYSDGSNAATDSGNNGSFTNTCNVISSRLNVVKKMSSSIFPTSGGEMIQPHIPFKDVQSSDKPRLLISKLNLCSNVYDFDDQDKDNAEKDLKRQVLVEILDFIVSESTKLAEPAMSAICKMCGDNLFREFPPKNSARSPRGETEDEDPWFDPAWSHLQLVYEILLRFVSLSSLDPKIAKQFIDHSFLSRLLNLFDSEDPRERECLKSVLHRIYGKFMVHRPFIRTAVSNIIYRFVFETEKHNGIAELLEIFGSVISGFALPLKKEHKTFLSRALIPLHKPKSVGMYHHQLTYCIVQFIEKEPKLTSVVINGLLKYWPVTSSQKQLMFLSELEELLELIRSDEFEKVMVPLFQRISCCLDSYHFQVAERAHFLWNNEHIHHLIMCNRQVIMPIVFSSLQRNSKNHWNRTVFNLTQNVMKMFHEVDEPLVVSCQGKFEEDTSATAAVVERRRLTWEQLEKVAGGGGFEPVSVLEKPAVAATACVVSC